MSTIAIVASDTHLSEASWTSRAGIQGDSFFGFQQVVDLAIINKCDLILTGDCWELMHQARPSSTTVDFVRKELDKLHQHGCRLYYLNGQHDQLASPYWFKAIHSWPIHVGGSEFEIKGVKFFALDFFEQAVAEEKLATVPDVDVVLLHQQWTQFTDSKFISPLSLAAVPHGRLLISGDMHQHIKSPLMERSGVLCISPGATHMRSINEPTEHFAIVIDEDLTVNSLPLLSRPVISWVISAESQFYDEIEAIRRQAVGLCDEAVQKGCAAVVAKPLLIIEDRADCGAIKLAELALLAEAFVIGKRVTRRDQAVEEAIDVLDQTVDVRELFLQLALERDPANAARAIVYRALVYDEDVALATRKAYSV